MKDPNDSATVDIDDQIKAMAKENAMRREEDQQVKFAAVKEEIYDLAVAVRDWKNDKAALETQVQELKDAIAAAEEEIYKSWNPFITGTDKAVIDFGDGLTVECNPVLNVSVEDNDKAIEWFKGNGYSDVLKYSIHHQTMKKIAREHWDKGELIDGLACTTFNVIKVR